jgi:hypothetical protein
MPSLADIAPAARPRNKRLEFLDEQGGKHSIIVRGLSALELADISARYPDFFPLLTEAQNFRAMMADAPEEEINAELAARFNDRFARHSGGAIAAMIAAATENFGDEREERLAAGFRAEVQREFMNAIFELTNPPADGGGMRPQPLSPLGDGSPKPLASEVAPAN